MNSSSNIYKRGLKKKMTSKSRMSGWSSMTLGSALGLQETKSVIFKVVLKILAVVMLLTFVMFHPLYLKTGTPMFKYGFSMMVLPPFYLLWALFKLVSVYLLGKSP